MQSSHRALFSGAWMLSLLAGCNYGSVLDTSTGSATLASTTPTNAAGGGGTTITGFPTVNATSPATDTVNATPSVAGAVSVTPGASQTITVAFTSADGRAVSGLALSNTDLPVDWSGPGSFTCAVTSTGSNCVLTLTYTPTATETGTLALGYVYDGDPNTPALVTLDIPYAATTANTIVASAAPIGQINAPIGSGTQSVSVNFTTDNGKAATGLAMVTDLTSLPTGWATTTPAFSCAIVSNGSGCQLVLNYAPTASGHGTLLLNYGYTDDSGTARTGAINVPYSTTVNGNVVATVSPAGQINAIQTTGSQPVKVTFTTDDGNAVQNVVLMSGQSALPAGWAGSLSGFSCGNASTGNSCQLALTYAPTTLSAGTVSLAYSYTSPTGVFTTGSVNIPYAATTSDNVVATAMPSGQINAIVSEVDPTVAVGFTTDDMRTATDLQLTTDLSALPAGWASATPTFVCAGVDGTTNCQLPLTYTPTAAASGTLTLRYAYLDNAGESKSGSINVPYRATTDDTVVGTASQSPVNVMTGTSTTVTVAFATSDGNPASGLSVSGLASLPAGWSSANGTYTCSSVSAGTACGLALTYTPTAADSGTVALGFSYTNDSGVVKSGTFSIPYSATVPGP